VPLHVVTELVQKEGVTPLQPGKFVWMEVDSSSPQGARTTAVRGLRDAPDESYEWFCENFMECVIPTTEWKLVARRKPMSQYITASLEAFALLVYKNAFDKWKEEFLSDEAASDNTDGLSSLTSSSGQTAHGFLFTGNSKGSRKYEGWNPTGMKFYNDVLTVIGQQRGRPGCMYDRKLLKRLAAKPKGRRRNEDTIQAPRANNNVDQLMQMIGV
jgi:hypothetical protein